MDDIKRLSQYLEQANSIYARVVAHGLEIERLRMLGECTKSAPKTKVRLESITTRLSVLGNEMINDIDQLIELWQIIRGLIELVPDYKVRLVLQSRYLCGRTWEEIASDLGCSHRTAF